MTQPILQMRDLRIETEQGLPLVKGVSLSLMPGEVLGLIGESGAGEINHWSCGSGLCPTRLPDSGGGSAGGREKYRGAVQQREARVSR
ncbi:Uncharacterised protein [Cedecea neteri]|uniref:Glutathione import ATP-binding protein GsiA n=1 Tax=Cedecea neteri TaxID=158822 RepID=A0A2X2SWF3_9ENTR|nr:Uncharacterised protein [Cedecea neteri]